MTTTPTASTTPSSDRLVDGVAALLRATRRARQLFADAHPGTPVGVVGLLTQIERGAAIEPAAHAGCRLKDVAAAVDLDTSTVSREITRLIELGLVERTTDTHDKRAIRLALTEHGRRHLAKARAHAADLLTGALRDWTQEEVDAFTTALHRFTADLAGHVAPAQAEQPDQDHDHEHQLEAAR